MSGAFNLQTGLVANNGQLPAIGLATGGGGGGVANVNGIVSRQGDGTTDLAVVIGAGLSYVPPGTAGGTLSATAPVAANVNGVVSRQGNATTDTAVLFSNGVKYTPAATAGGLIDILPAPTADMKNTATTGGEQFLSDPDGIQLRATNTPASVGGDCVFTYKNATTNYAWEAPAASTGTGMPIGCMIMYYTNTGFTTDPAGAANGYFLNFGTECWKLCDGTTGSIPATGSAFGATPDLINKFARGINTSAPPALIPENININVGAITLTNTELPAHDHAQVSVAVSATTDAPSNCDHEHNNCGGTWGFNYWIPNGGSGTGGGGGLGSTLCNNLSTSPCPAYGGGGGSAGGNRTGGLSSSVGNLASHTHTFTFSTPATTTGTTGLGQPFTPTAGGINIKPTSYDVLYIVRVF